MEHKQFETFFRANYNKAFFLALRLLHDEEASRDVVADSFEKVWGRMEGNKLNVNNLDAYLLVVVRNMALEWLRKMELHDRYAKMELHHQEKTCADQQSLLEREQRMEKLMVAL